MCGCRPNLKIQLYMWNIPICRTPYGPRTLSLYLYSGLATVLCYSHPSHVRRILLGSSYPFYIQELKCLCGSGSKAPSLFMPAFPNCSIKSHGAAFVFCIWNFERGFIWKKGFHHWKEQAKLRSTRHTSVLSAYFHVLWRASVHLASCSHQACWDFCPHQRPNAFSD